MGIIAPTFYGSVEGREEGDLCVFKGVPYAAPPVGNRRWEHPEPPEPWEGLRDACEYVPHAPQNPSALDTLLGRSERDEGHAEDCLYLNIWTPGLDEAKRPVMVWIHGGGFTIGAGSQPIYDGGNLASRGDVVVVTINYRLGALGFLNLNELTNGAIPASGNEGLLDQVEALSWVRDNILGFGGDPDNVTIFGESAGGMSVGALLALPAAKGLFHKAIPQSGACHTALSLAQGRAVANAFLECLGVDANGLRDCSVEALLVAQTELATKTAGLGLPGMSFQPVVDGKVLPSLPIEAVAAGHAAGIPLLAGSLLEEWKLFTALDPTGREISQDKVDERVRAWAQGHTGKFVHTYRAFLEARGKPAEPIDILTAINTDRVFRMPAIRLLEAQKPHESRVYSYLFDWESPMMEGMLGACHALELGFVFATHDKAPLFFGSGNGADRLAAQTMDIWVNFAYGGDPSGELLGRFPDYETSRRSTMVLGSSSGICTAPHDDIRALWDLLGDEAIGQL